MNHKHDPVMGYSLPDQYYKTNDAREQEARKLDLAISALRLGRLPATAIEASFLLIAAEVLPESSKEKGRLRNIGSDFFVRSGLPTPSPLDAMKQASVTDLPRLRNHLTFHLSRPKPAREEG